MIKQIKILTLHTLLQYNFNKHKMKKLLLIAIIATISGNLTAQNAKTQSSHSCCPCTQDRTKILLQPVKKIREREENTKQLCKLPCICGRLPARNQHRQEPTSLKATIGNQCWQLTLSSGTHSRNAFFKFLQTEKIVTLTTSYN